MLSTHVSYSLSTRGLYMLAPFSLLMSIGILPVIN
ncbi:putative membrane protein (plasmid) [Erwinia amylovora LA635]|uniref:Putative membrane protein n=1 Tax=Erwinia amylovora TaxID=552 RepID=A0A0P0ZHI3_ERWAM|nr:putative membrane protein [Erwinia amylovora LA635]CDK23806.1 hypothetical protein LA636_p1028 [Erwinia amylovora LA636]CDK23856.1 hypothetical protein LA637_p1029 [Erwinia amylovora LA637]CDM08154.1 putative membrane protein [Erwinia amylovora]